jgi:hypothetical protein
MERSPFYPFPPRPGTNAIEIDYDTSARHVELIDEQVQDAETFEHELYGISLDPETIPSAENYRLAQKNAGTPMVSIEAAWRKKANTTDLGISYFLTDEGRQALSTITTKPLDYESPLACYSFLSGLNIKDVDSKVLDKLQADSIKHEEAKQTEAFIEGNFKGDNLDSLQILTLYKHPKLIAEKAQAYRQLKTYLKLVKSDLIEHAADNGSTDNHDTKTLIVDLYKKKVNRLLVAIYIDAYRFLNQQQAAGNNENQAVVTEIEKVLPAFSSESKKPVRANFLQNLDRYRYGVSELEDGQYTWLSPEAKHLASKALEGAAEGQDIDRGEYSDIAPNLLSETEIDGQTFGKWLSLVLEEYGMLSEDMDWDSEREGPPSDGKWQVIVNDKFKSLSVSDKQRIMMVPATSRSILSAIILANHEITHVLQNHNKRAISHLSILESIGLDSVSEQTEAGGKWQEQIARETLTGKPDNRIAGTGYMRAIEVKEQGGSFGECVEVYYEELISNEPEMDKEKASAQAVNRARRVFRAGGKEYAQDLPVITNTQPLSYLEQQLIYKNLSEEQRKLLFVGGVTIDNLIAISKVGLVDTNDIYIPDRMPMNILYPEVKQLIN